MSSTKPAKKPSTKLIKPREAAKLLRKKLKEIKTKLPLEWRTKFILDNPEYKGQQDFLSNVMAGRSMHEETILKIESWLQHRK